MSLDRKRKEPSVIGALLILVIVYLFIVGIGALFGAGHEWLP